MKIAVAGTGYVGLSNAILLSQNNQVYAMNFNQDIFNIISLTILIDVIILS